MKRDSVCGGMLLLSLHVTVLSAETPSAGSQLQQIPPAPLRQVAPPDLPPPHAPLAPAYQPSQQAFLVAQLRITGATIYSEAALLSISGFEPNSQMGLPDLQALAARITDYYQRNGYFVARAYVPEQDISAGTVKVVVLEGHYDKVEIRSSGRLSLKLQRTLLKEVRSGAAVSTAPLEEELLLLSDLPGVKLKSTLSPGSAVGTSDLLVKISDSSRVTGSIDADNQGSRYTGRQRLGATINLNEPTGQGDLFNVRVLSSDSGLSYGRLAYQLQLGRIRIGAAYSTLQYKLGQEFTSLKANGTARTTSVYASYPLLRSRDANLLAQGGYDAKAFRDRTDATTTVTDKKSSVWLGSLSGERHDGLGRGGVSAGTLNWTHGRLDIVSDAALAADRATAATQGHYSKFGLSALRQQALSNATTLVISATGQLAAKNLDNSEKFSLGGPNAVRAYPEGEAYGDSGYVLSLETRTMLPNFLETQPGTTQAIAFVDTGKVTLNATPWTATQNHRTLSGAGAALQWVAADGSSVKMTYAQKVGNAKATSVPDASQRVWLQVVKFF